MRYSALTLLVPCALVLSACTTPVTPAFKDIGSRSGPCIEGGPDAVAQQFYDYRIQHRGNDLTALRPYLSDNLAKLLNDASRDPQQNALLSSIRSPAAPRCRTAPTSPARPPFRIPTHGIFLCA